MIFQYKAAIKVRLFFSRVVSLTNYDKYYYFFIRGNFFFFMKLFLSGEFCRHLYVFIKNVIFYGLLSGRILLVNNESFCTRKEFIVYILTFSLVFSTWNNASVSEFVALTQNSYTLQTEAWPIGDHHTNCGIQCGDSHL